MLADDERVAFLKRRDVEERDCALILVDFAGGNLARDDFAEDADVRHGRIKAYLAKTLNAERVRVGELFRNISTGLHDLHAVVFCRIQNS